MSLQTTIARGEWAHQDREWKSHRAHCPRYAGAARQRRWHLPCQDGAGIRDERAAARREYDRNLALDREPVSGQMTLSNEMNWRPPDEP